MPARILLVNPPVPEKARWVREGRCQQRDIWGAPYPPLSLARVSAQLARAGFETRIIDAGPEGKDLGAVLNEGRSFAPGIVFLTAATPTLRSDLGWFAPALKKRLPAAKIAAMGVHVTALPEQVLSRYGALDFAVLGEPEAVALDLASALSSGGSVDPVRGIACRDERGLPRVHAPARPIEDIDSLGFPDWGKVDRAKYLMPIVGRPFTVIEFSRGCPYACGFCMAHAYGGRRIRRRSVDSMLEEIRFNLSLGVEDFLFWSELMTEDGAFLDRFLDTIIGEGLPARIRWVCNSRVDGLTAELAGRMRRAGCWQIAFGFEFGDERILRLARKGGSATLERGRRAAEAAHDAGIAASGHFVMGYPGESIETLRATAEYARSLPLTFAHFYAAAPFPGSPLFLEALEKGWLDPADVESISQDKASLRLDGLEPAAVDREIRRAYRSFYLDPRVLRRICRLPASPREFAGLAALGLRALPFLKLL